MTFVKACKVDDVKSGEGKVVFVESEEIAVFNNNGNFYATDNTCPHRGGPLGEGMLDGEVVTCPWHGWRINVRTGKVTTMPVSVKTYTVKVEGDDVLVDV